MHKSWLLVCHRLTYVELEAKQQYSNTSTHNFMNENGHRRGVYWWLVSDCVCVCVCESQSLWLCVRMHFIHGRDDNLAGVCVVSAFKHSIFGVSVCHSIFSTAHLGYVVQSVLLLPLLLLFSSPSVVSICAVIVGW